ncbi:hypothetical protein [Bradyrhizobium oligotrophicum]|uniref:hypothetical protein n=1 Tax=Bradyrhizobium oligotrophicum TaxID=44255 RepID=UPI003EBE6DDA
MSVLVMPHRLTAAAGERQPKNAMEAAWLDGIPGRGRPGLMVRDGAARLLTMRVEGRRFDPTPGLPQSDLRLVTLRSRPQAGVSKGEARIATTPP